MKVKTIVIMGIVSLLFVGCAKPGFSPNNKMIVFVEGKPFRVPANGATYKTKTYKNTKLDKEKIRNYNKKGMNCRVGDIFWGERSTLEKGQQIMKSSGKNQAYAFMASEAAKGKTGCAHPLSAQEYQFYREKEIQNVRNNNAQAQARGKAIQDAANGWADSHRNISYIPATNPNVNVHHSGTINQNVNVNTSYR